MKYDAVSPSQSVRLQGKSSSAVFMTRLDRSEGVYKHNEGFIFSMGKIDFVKDFVRPQRFLKPEYLYQASRESCYEYLKKQDRDTCA
jgi:hypothetical protein|nr:MAG TPA: hypothetical protein [Caudoviricetes sp.]